MAKNTHNMADVIRRTITKQGWSLNQLGIKTGVDDGRLSRFMTGKRDLTLQAASRLVDALGLRLVEQTKRRTLGLHGDTSRGNTPPRRPPSAADRG
jgi:ribosome-binding protein aMBF1 (putative translation factor)